MTRAICCKQSSITNQLIALADRGRNLPMIIRPFASERCNTATCCRNGETNLIKCFYSFSCQLYSKLQCGLRTWPTLYSSLCEAWCIYAWAEYWQHAFMVIFLWLNVNVHGVGCRRESSKKDSDVRLRSIITIKNISAWIWLAPDWLNPFLAWLSTRVWIQSLKVCVLGIKASYSGLIET